MSETNQPIYKCIANLGDRSPIDYGGYFVYVDTTGVYPPQATLLETEENGAGKLSWREYRFCLDRLEAYHLQDELQPDEREALTAEECTKTYLIPYGFTARYAKQDDSTPFMERIPYHPSTYDEWFNKDLESVAETMGMDVVELRTMFCSEDPVERAQAYREVGMYHGFENFDSYPLTHKRETAVRKRFKQAFDELKAIGGNI